MKRVVLGLLAVLGLGLVTRADDAPADRSLRQAFTKPDKEYKISFPTMGVIREVRIKEGDVIRKGDILMVQDDREDRAELRILELDVNEYAIKAAEAKLRVAQVELTMKENLNKATQGYSELEVQRARADRDVAEAQLNVSKQELKQKEAKRDKQAQHVENMTLKAETNGVVKEIINDIGSNVDPTKPVVTVVENNPLQVEVQVPSLASLQLKKGDKMRVSYDRKTWREATVSYLSPQADAAGGTRPIYLELANPDGEPSGLQIFVELPEKLLAAAAADGK